MVVSGGVPRVELMIEARSQGVGSDFAAFGLRLRKVQHLNPRILLHARAGGGRFRVLGMLQWHLACGQNGVPSKQETDFNALGTVGG